MPTPPRPRRLWDAYRFPGFQPSPTVTGIFGDPHARVITLTRRSKNALWNLRPRSAMVDRHWDGIATYCHAENKVALGLVEGLNNKIRVLQRRAYGLRDEEYLRLKILTCMLPAI